MLAALPERPFRLVAAAALLGIAAGHAAGEERPGDLEGAIAEQRAVVREIVRTSDRRDPRLAAPLRDLGRTLAAAGRHGEAATVFGEAVFVRRASAGLDSLEQLELYDEWMESLYAAGRDEEVAARQLGRVAIVERAAGGGSAELLAALGGAAAWLRRVGRSDEERELHERRLEILRAGESASDEPVVGVLRDVASSYGAAYEPDVRAPLALTQALELAGRSPGADRTRLAAILAELGDFYFLFRSFPSAHHYYDRARALLAGDDEEFAALFGEARALRVPEPRESGTLAREPSYAEAHLSLTVDERGNVHDVDVVEIRPDTRAARRAAVGSAAGARFRPRFTASGPVVSEDVRYLHRFRYVEGMVEDAG